MYIHTHLHTPLTVYNYFRDNRETMKELTDKERSEIQEAEEARSVNIMFMMYMYYQLMKYLITLPFIVL